MKKLSLITAALLMAAGSLPAQEANQKMLTTIREANEILAAPADYLPDAVSELKDITRLAEAAAGEGYSQTYADKVHSQLQRCIAAVKRTAGMVLPDAQQLPYSTNRGFIHPGGLHTQADFDRIKRQLDEGNSIVTRAYNVLKSAEYAQSGASSSPVETIIRGEGAQNYINAARGATIAYQNALRWKIEGNKACANHAVSTLMAWARTTKGIGGNSNYALAAGLYGYQFAQAAELMRDYDGWAAEDFEEYKQWMLNVWYPSAIGFLRGRNGTWENAGRWWQAPGHYWSNWGLCNALCVSIIGILCDDVFIYNQGMSYFKYDQVGTFTKERLDNPIKNDGLTEFLGNLVVTTYPSDLETGAYGMLGQMNESGRDTGHAAMALGLAVDMAKVGWNQGDDLFAYMDHRLAAGIEYIAAQTQSISGLPWRNYIYGDNGHYYTDSRCWTMTAPALGAQTRPYWGTVIGIYEGVKGVRMPFAETSYKNMGIDGGGSGSTSGAYDHLGYSVLMNTYDKQLAEAAEVPTEISGRMAYSGTLNSNLIPSMSVENNLGNINGSTISHNEIGGLVNSFTANNKTCVPRGETLTLMPQLPEGEEDTGLWTWNTGENTRDITVKTDRSFIYRATYTNKNGVKSQQSFAVAVQNDCNPTAINPTIEYNGKTFSDCDSISVLYGETATLNVNPTCGWGTFQWSTGQTTQSITTAPVVTPRQYTAYYYNQGSGISTRTFHISVAYAEPYIQSGTSKVFGTETILAQGASATLGLKVPEETNTDEITWTGGAKGAELALDNVQTSGQYTATYTVGGTEVSVTFNVYVKGTEAPVIEKGDYAVRDRASGRLLTAHDKDEAVTFEEGDANMPAATQIWTIDTRNGKTHCITNPDNGLTITNAAKMSTLKLFTFYFDKAEGVDFYSIHSGASASNIKYWTVTAAGDVDLSATTLEAYPFELIPAGGNPDAIRGISETGTSAQDTQVYDITGRRVSPGQTRKGIYIINGRKLSVR
ncbi:MAG: alginate lyase family protein [Prevotellaceae bacterium]|nr:alginate lyase family protein [Prevotellaceae bacterium]